MVSKRLIPCALLLLALSCLVFCARVQDSANPSDSPLEASGVTAPSDSSDALPHLPSTSLPDRFDIADESVFSDLDPAEIGEARAIFPLVSSYTLSKEETAELVEILAAATTMPSVSDASRASVWFELDFQTGETWLLMGEVNELAGTFTLTVGTKTLALGLEAQNQLVDLYGRCEDALQQEVSYVMPFEGLMASDLDCVESSVNMSSWLKVTDESAISKLVEILAGMKVNGVTGTRDLIEIYGGDGDSYLFRLTFKDSSVITVGSYEAYTVVCGIAYASKDNGLLEFYGSL